MDTINTPTIRKKLKTISAQDPGESRRRWQHVTEALWNRDVDAATDAKHAVRIQTSVQSEGMVGMHGLGGASVLHIWLHPNPTSK